MLGNLVVYFRGRTSSIRKLTEDVNRVALQLLTELIHRTLAETKAAANDLPSQIQSAALECVEDFEDRGRIHTLIEAFGAQEVGSHAHRQVSWLCLNVLDPVVPAWKTICDDDAPEQILAELRAWMVDSTRAVDWNRARRQLVGTQGGVRIQDCNACWIEPIARGVAGCANYLHTANIDSAVTTVEDSWAASTEGCWPQSEERTFEKWFVDVAVVNAYHCAHGE